MARTVLVVDDEEDVRAITSWLLQANGYCVRTAANGAEALALLEPEPPDLILLDMLMPVMDGWQFARELRARARSRIPLVVVTAADHPARRAAEVDADGFVSKPFDLEELLAAVRRWT
jgi:CheY-like chemotaxis protein